MPAREAPSLEPLLAFGGRSILIDKFDFRVIHFLNTFANRSRVFDSVFVILGDADLLKGGVVLALLCWAWARTEATREDREILVFSFLPIAFSLLVARGLALILPFRPRPLNNPLLHFQPIHLADPKFWIPWSSFPSDHAALFFCLATVLWMVSRRLGSLAAAYVLLAICFPRIYLVIHYPTDIAAGAVLGMGSALLCKLVRLRKAVTRPALRLLERYPARFYAAAFLLTFETAEMFESVRRIAMFGLHGVQTVLNLR